MIWFLSHSFKLFQHSIDFLEITFCFRFFSMKHVAFDNLRIIIWAETSEFGTYRLCEQRRFRRACASAQSRQNLRCSLIQAVSQEEPSDRKPDPWPLWMTGHAQLKFVMTECSKTQIRLTGPISTISFTVNLWFSCSVLSLIFQSSHFVICNIKFINVFTILFSCK